MEISEMTTIWNYAFGLFFIMAPQGSTKHHTSLAKSVAASIASFKGHPWNKICQHPWNLLKRGKLGNRGQPGGKMVCTEIFFQNYQELLRLLVVQALPMPTFSGRYALHSFTAWRCSIMAGQRVEGWEVFRDKWVQMRRWKKTAASAIPQIQRLSHSKFLPSHASPSHENRVGLVVLHEVANLHGRDELPHSITAK